MLMVRMIHRVHCRKPWSVMRSITRGASDVPRDREQDRRSRRPDRQVAEPRERAEIDRAHDVAEGLRDRLGGVGGLAVERALLEEDVESEPADAGQDLDNRGHHAGEERHAAPLDVRAHGRGQGLHHERHQAEQEVDRRLVRHEGDRPHDREGERGADARTSRRSATARIAATAPRASRWRRTG